MTHAPHYAKALKYAHADHAAWVKSVSDARTAGDTNVQRFYADWLEDRGHPLHHLVRADADRRDRIRDKNAAGGQVPWDDDYEVPHGPLPVTFYHDDPVTGPGWVRVGGGSHCTTFTATHATGPGESQVRGVVPREAAVEYLDYLHEIGAHVHHDSYYLPTMTPKVLANDLRGAE